MAPRGQAASREREQTVEEFQRDVNAAVANTEAEIMADALGDEELDNDADTSLEEMGDGLEGDDLGQEETADELGDPDDQREAIEAQGAEGEQGEEPEPEDEPGAEGEYEDEEFADEPQQPAPREQRQQEPAREFRGVPPGVHREQRQRARVAEDRNSTLERELAETRGRLEQLTAIVAQGGPQPRQRPQTEERPDPMPDMFAQPAEYQAWQNRQVEQAVNRALQAGLNGFRQEMRQTDESRINASFADAAQGPRGWEFDAAYRALTSLDPRDRNAQATVARIVRSADPARALFGWWDRNGAQEYRAEIARQLNGGSQDEDYDDGYGNGYEPAPRGRQRQSGRGPQQRQQPQRGRSEFRLPPSLNGARGGGGREQNADPDLLDDSDRSVMSFAMR